MGGSLLASKFEKILFSTEKGHNVYKKFTQNITLHLQTKLGGAFIELNASGKILENKDAEGLVLNEMEQNIDKVNLGKYIKSQRTRKGLTQQELADKIGVTDRAISNWENGRRLPDLSLIKVVASELDISVAELLNGRKLNKEELEELKITINNLLEYNTMEEIKKIKKSNSAFTVSFVFIVLAIVGNELNFTSDIFNMEVASSYLLGSGVGIGLIALLNNYLDLCKQKNNLNKSNNNLVLRLKKRANSNNNKSR